MDESNYPLCDHCKEIMQPVWFIEHERRANGALTGRKRRNVEEFVCPACLRSAVVDDSFAEPWKN